MYNLARTLTNSCSCVSLHTIKIIPLRAVSSSHGYQIKKKWSMPSLPLFSMGSLIDRLIKRGVSNFSIHPEKLKQIIKAHESHTLCNFFASEEYKNRLQAIVEKQKRLLSEDSPIGIPKSEIKYEHVLNCAQPIRVPRKKLKEDKKEKEEEPVITLLEKKKKKENKPVRTTIMSLILRKKKQEQEEMFAKGHTTIMPIVMQAKMRNLEMKRKFRKRTTVLPIFLKKMEELKKESESNLEQIQEESLNKYYKVLKKAAPKFKSKTENNDSRKSQRNENSGGNEKIKQIEEKYLETESKDNRHTRNLVLTPKYSKQSFFNEDILKRPETISIIVEKTQSDSKGLSKRFSSTSQNIYRNEENHEDVVKNTKTSGLLGRLVNRWKKAGRSNNKKQEISKSCAMNLPMEANYEIDHSFVNVLDVSNIGRRSLNPPEELKAFPSAEKDFICDVFTLFDRVKSGSKNKPLKSIDDRKYSGKGVSFKSIDSQITSREPSLTYKIVCGDKERKKKELRDKFIMEVDHSKQSTLQLQHHGKTNKKKDRQKSVPLALTFPTNSSKELTHR